MQQALNRARAAGKVHFRTGRRGRTVSVLPDDGAAGPS